MRVVGLLSGGKDSVYNMLQCIAAGHEVVAIANIEPSGNKDELDSYMYQTVGHQALSLISAAMSLPIYRQRTKGIAVCKEKVYVQTVGDEVEDLFALLSKVKVEMHIDGVSVGAIESDYQRTRVENVCFRLNLKCFAYLWKRNQEELLQEMIQAGINAVVVKVGAIGLNPESHLGISIADLQPILLKLHKKFGVHICGEGGEYETLTVDCPLYHRKIEIIESEKLIHSDDAFAPIGYLNIKNAKLETKVWRDQSARSSGQSKLEYIKSIIRPPLYYVHDCLDEVTNEVPGEETRLSEDDISQEVLPFPFGSWTNVNEAVTEAKASPSIRDKAKAGILSDSNAHGSREARFSPSAMVKIDQPVTQLNLTTGWCCVGNVTAPSIRDGLTVVQKYLERYQYELRDVVSISLYVKDMGEWPKMNKTYSQIVPSRCLPARACVAVPLPPDVAVAITVVAHRLVSKTQKVVHYTEHTVDREYIHIQSISHWAPANIGPYSQCIRVGEMVYVAGQIPLVPGTMELLNRPISQQCRLALRHIFRILTAINESYTMDNVMHGICFVTTEETAAEVSRLWSCLTKNEHAAIATVVVSSLPKSAPLEWQVQACGYSDPRVSSGRESISEELVMNYKRCLFANHNTSSVVCNISKRSSKKDKMTSDLTSDNVIAVMKQCVHILRGEMAGPGTPLCMLNVFFKASESDVALAVNDTLKTSLDFKVVISCIPVVACAEPSVLITITGICH